ncbi:5'-deoxynucleotidase [Alteromonas sediminis]|uniref:5'-deoxynucleotidase n=1 Tax=Alteromonas sediminis TaxID=2259342 RepID=UPI0014048AC6|nr:5'-deoxynucleotidase [Alteromonas sediminis]
MKSNFLAWIYRQRFIKRWNRMDNSVQTDVDLHSHCLNVSVVAHLLAEIDNRRFGRSHNAERIALLGIYHECAEGVSGDLPSPIKYASPTITREIKQMEDEIERTCARSLPMFLQPVFDNYIIQKNVDADAKRIIKAADDIVAWFKCKEEVEKSGNIDFTDALINLEEKVNEHSSNLPCVQWFLDNFESGYTKTIDKLMQPG